MNVKLLVWLIDWCDLLVLRCTLKNCSEILGLMPPVHVLTYCLPEVERNKFLFFLEQSTTTICNLLEYFYFPDAVSLPICTETLGLWLFFFHIYTVFLGDQRSTSTIWLYFASCILSGSSHFRHLSTCASSIFVVTLVQKAWVRWSCSAQCRLTCTVCAAICHLIVKLRCCVSPVFAGLVSGPAMLSKYDLARAWNS